MADKKTELLYQFYQQCQEKGYTDMKDATQSLKAKVIATDLGLKYTSIEKLYQSAIAASEVMAREEQAAWEYESPGYLFVMIMVPLNSANVTDDDCPNLS